MDEYSEEHLLAERVRKTFRTGKSKDLVWRKRQLTQLQRMVEENHEVIAEAIAKDLGGPKVRSTFDMLGIHEQARIALENLDEWAADEKVTHTEMFGSSYLRKEPKGVVLVIGPFNFPFFCTLGPLVSVIAAGCCAVCKPSEVASHSAQVMEDLFPKYLDQDAIVCHQGGIPETTRLLAEPWGSIMYTGSETVGRIVLNAAAKHMTPVVLELGGKSPVIVDETADVESAAQRVVLSKFMNAGQICIAADYVLCHRSKKAELVSRIAELFKKTGGGDSSKVDSWGKIINARHCTRIGKLLDSTTGKKLSPCLPEGKHAVDEANRHVSPTVIDEPAWEDEVMKEEIFGPLLPIKAVDSVQEAVEHVHRVCATPLALYVFSNSQKNIDYVIHNTTSGGVCVNSAMEHISNPLLSFGGVGTSGQGSYFAKHGFDNFSHKRSVFVKSNVVTKEGLLPIPGTEGYPEWLYGVACKIQFGILPDYLRVLSRKQTKRLAMLVVAYFVLRRVLLK